ncbi:MAG: family 10 glycosylhydrolase [Muribaculaceae bacterium]|nr:family 10 glycosylhydrolase [Muribaculaceae bacterium]
MKKQRFILIALLAALAASFVTAVADTAPKREQRGMWTTAYLSDWPSGAITQSNTPIMQNACRKMLDTLRVNHINTIYYHVRAMCDAMYNSAYEPWSGYVSGTRGVAPAFDPFQYLVDEAHKRGIEVYAWVNPYRYGHGDNMWGQSELDYIHTHPEWLLTTSYETVLNPGIPEVRQRVVDVCKDILVKYDVDGLVFDDYFYNQDNPSFSLDADLYSAYQAAGGTMSQGDWRRENVNQMVKDVNDMVKQVKPWVRFGIGPAGVACTNPAVAEQYGVEPCPVGSDWQYSQIYSDPMAWVTRGTIDFLAPQVYWKTTGTFTGVTTWWGKMAARFNRHIFISQWVPDEEGWTLAEFVKQGRVMREAMAAGGNPGMVYFRYSTWRNKKEVIDGKVRQLRTWLKDSLYPTIALNPAPAWLKPDQTYTTVTGLEYNDGTLAWDSIPNVRYVIYTIPDSVEDRDFHCQAEYIDGISYWVNYTLPANKREGYRYAVSILDRWENEYAPATPGATPTAATQPVLTYPGDGDEVTELSLLQWDCDAATYMVQVFADQQMDSLVAQVEVDSLSCPLTKIPGLTDGTYWWRVIARGLNQWDNASELRQFTLGQMHITAPADAATTVPLTPVITWTAGGTGTNYVLELSTAASMNNPDTLRLTEPQWQVPRYRLAGATTYYARVTATYGDMTVVTPVSSFTTVEVIPPVPAYLCPAISDTVLYNTDVVAFEPIEGAASLRVQISNSVSFPTRTSYNGTLEGTFETPQLGDIKGSGKLTDGGTYYVRARYAYRTLATGATMQYTDYCDVRSFVYHVITPGDVNGDSEVNIADVNALIDLILSGQTSVSGDVNGDGEINIGDVNALLALILT